MNKVPKKGEHAPENRLLFEIEIDRLVANLPEAKPLDPKEIQKATERIQAFHAKYGIEPTIRSNPPVIPLSWLQLSRSISVDPIASHAAAETIKLTVQWENGTIRFLQSTMRADLAIEVLVDEAKQYEFNETIFLISFEDKASTIAVFPGQSPVFCGLLSKDFRQVTAMDYDWFHLKDITASHLDILKRSKRSLRDPKSLKLYNQLIKQAETD